MKRKHVILLAVALVLAVLWTSRYIRWNNYLEENYLTTHRYFEQGENVEFGSNYIYYGAPSTTGYSLSVQGSVVKPCDEYFDEIGLVLPAYWASCQVLELTCDISCSIPEPEQLALNGFIVHGVNWVLNPIHTALNALYGNGVYLDETGTGRISIPFLISESEIDYIPNAQDCYLKLTAYPEIIEVRFEWPQ